MNERLEFDVERRVVTAVRDQRFADPGEKLQETSGSVRMSFDAK